MVRESIRASELDRVLACHVSLPLSRRVAKREGNEGLEGEQIHYLIADYLVREFGAIPPEGGLKKPNLPPGFKLSPFSVWIVDWAINHVRETIPSDWSLMVEVEMRHEFERWDNTGHADVIGISPDGTQFKGIDWKSGRDPVDPAENNWQIADYTALVKLTWDSILKGSFDLCQPRLTEDDEYERISTARFNEAELAALPAGIDKAVCEALDAPFEVEIGRKSCRWCPAAIQCSELKSKRDYMKNVMTKEAVESVKLHPDPATLADWVIASKILAQPMKDATEAAAKLIEADGQITSSEGTRITMTTQKGSYTVERPVELWNTIRDLISEEGRAMCASWSVTKLIDTISKEKGIPKEGKSAITGRSILEAQCLSHMRQGVRRLFKFN